MKEDSHNPKNSKILQGSVESGFKKLVDTLSDSVVFFTKTGILYFNTAFQNLTCYPTDRLHAMTFTDLFLEIHRERIGRLLTDLVSGTIRHPVTEQIKLKTAEGMEVPVQVDFSVFSADGIQVVQAVIKDISGFNDTLDKLKESEERFRFLTESTFEGIIVHRNGIVIDTNDSFLRITGFKREELVGNNILFSAYSEEDRNNLIKNIGKTHAKPYVARLRRKNGQGYYAEIEGLDVRYKGEDVRIAAIRDVTERVRLQKELQEGKRKLQDLIGNLPGVIYTALNNKDWDILFMSEGSRELLGYDAEVFMKGELKFADVIHPEDRERVWDKTQEQIKRNSKFQVEYRVITKTGKVKWVWERGARIWNEDKEFLEGFITDISTKKKAEQDLLNSEKRLKILSNSSFEAIFVTEQGICTDQNSTAGKLFGYSREEAVGRVATDWIVPEDRAKVAQNILKNYTGVYEATGLRKDGSRFPCEIQGISTVIEGKKVRITALRDISERKNAEKERVENEEKFRSIFENKGTATAIIDQKGFILLANQKCEELFGYRQKDLESGLSWMDLAHPEDMRMIAEQQSLRYSKDKKALSSYEIRIIGKDKNVLDVLLNIDLIPQSGNRVVSLIDITERKNAERELKASEERFKNYIEYAPFGIFVADETGRYVDVNKAAEEITGYSREELLKINLLDIISPEYRSLAGEAFMNLVKFNEAVSIELEYIKKSGEVRVWHVNAVLSSENRFLGFTRDVTELKAYQDELIEKNRQLLIQKEKVLENEERHRFLFENMTQGVLYHNKNGEIVYANKAASEILGLSQEQLRGKSAKDPRWKSINEDGSQCTAENHPASITLKTGKAVYNQKMGVYIPENDRYTWLNITSQPKFRKGDKEPWQVMVTFEDITSAMEREKELQMAKEKAEESDRLKSAFLTNMSHEIRTPMNGILGFTSLLLEAELPEEDRKTYLKIIEKSGERMLSTINDIIDVSMIEAGSVNKTITKVNIDSILADLHSFFRREAEAKGLELTMNKEGGADSLFTDEQKLISILTNLLKNAVKFTHKGKVEINYSVFAGVFKISVKDTGIGIPEDKIKAVFSRFNKVDSSNSQFYEGSGLGLSISKSYLKLLGGSIRLESKEGEGSCFYVELPSAKK